jgi:hypothetical protein
MNEGTAMNSNQSRPVPPANTGSKLLDVIADTTLALVHFERRFDPFFRPAFDAVLRDPLARFVTWLINLQRVDEKLALAEEKPLPGEEEFVDSIIASFQQQMRGLWKPGGFERGGNTKTQGIVRADFIVHDGLPAEMRRGIFAEPKTYRAWVRFSGPGPYITPDIDDVGFMSISIKLMGVPGPKLMDEEKFTLDMFGVSPPTFVTPDVRANAQLQIESLKNASIYYFVNLHRPHILDGIMQGLFIKTQSSPFEAPYFSCVPYLLGEGQAMQYSVWPKTKKRTPIRACRCGLPTTTCARRWSSRSTPATSSSTFASSARPTPTACRSRTRRCSGPNDCRREFPSRRCGFRARSSTLQRRWNSPSVSRTTRGTRSPSIARSATRAVRAAACTWPSRRFAIR